VRWIWQVKSEAEEERSGREDATAAVIKMQSIINAVREEMVEAQLAADQCVPLACSPHHAAAVCHAAAIYPCPLAHSLEGHRRDSIFSAAKHYRNFRIFRAM
jgi:hypothetical protein